MEERRMFQRFGVDFPVKFLNLTTNKEGTGTMVNISASGGGMMITSEFLAVSSHLKMQLFISGNKDPFTINGKVIWSKTIEADKCMAGVQFDKVDFMGIAGALKFKLTS